MQIIELIQLPNDPESIEGSKQKLINSLINLWTIMGQRQFYKLKLIILKFQFFIQTITQQMACFQAFNNMCKKIVCPIRHQLNEDQMIQRKFRSNNVQYDKLMVKNKQGHNLSLIVFQKSFINFPTVLYLHGNGGHKLESLQIALEEINLIAFDFCGCGKSEGQYLTYGEKQVQDIRAVVEFVTRKYNIKKLSLWGRSMGASLAIMYSAKYPQQISSIILDTPFRFLKQVVYNVAEQSSKSIPGFLINIAVYFIQKRTQSIVGSNVFETDFSSFLLHINIPILFSFSTKDTVVKEQDVRQLYSIYKGPKKITNIESLHHQDRPKSFIETGYKFIVQSGSMMENGVRSLQQSKYSYSRKVFVRQTSK